VNGQNQVRQKARAELPFPKNNREIKKYGQICPAQKKLGQGQTKRTDLPAGRKRGFLKRALVRETQPAQEQICCS